MANSGRECSAAEISKEKGPPRRPEFEALWRLNQSCNYRCEYCFRSGVDEYRQAEHPECGKYRPTQIAKAFDDTGKIWRIHMTGGEPFLYPDFVSLAKALTARHHISINTNLSTSNVYDFADQITPSSVHSINASLHLAERQKRKDGLERFIQCMLHLQKKGFNVRLMYITYPPLLSRLKNDLTSFRSQGISGIYVKVFRGRYENELYPAAFTKDQRALILSAGIPGDERAILQGETNFFGRQCVAGSKAFDIDISGNLTRCSAINKGYGNIFTGRYCFDEQASPCSSLFCNCPYQGLKFTQRKTYEVLSKLMRRTFDAFLPKSKQGTLR